MTHHIDIGVVWKTFLQVLEVFWIHKDNKGVFCEVVKQFEQVVQISGSVALA